MPLPLTRAVLLHRVKLFSQRYPPIAVTDLLGEAGRIQQVEKERLAGKLHSKAKRKRFYGFLRRRRTSLGAEAQHGRSASAADLPLTTASSERLAEIAAAAGEGRRRSMSASSSRSIVKSMGRTLKKMFPGSK